MAVTRPFFCSLILLFNMAVVCLAQDSHKNTAQNLEAREDSAKLADALNLQASFKQKLTPNAETEPVASLSGEDAADDPAIWVNTNKPEKSLILGTNKKAGLYVYNLKGEKLQFIPSGLINNVDLRDNFSYKSKKVALVAASNRSINAISLYVINRKTGILSDTIANIYSGVDEVYGICMYHNHKTDQFFVIINGKGGEVEQWEISYKKTGLVFKKVRDFSVSTQPEGMVADDKTGMLFLGVENEGIFHTRLDTDSIHLEKIKGSDESNPAISYDIEGLSLFNYKDSTYLIASIQGNFSYALFSTGINSAYKGSFTIVDNKLIDGVEETDGLDITTLNCGKTYPNGILVVQDGFNTKNGKDENQNFKIISAERIFPFIK